jgi:alpha-galactosidase
MKVYPEVIVNLLAGIRYLQNKDFSMTIIISEFKNFGTFLFVIIILITSFRNNRAQELLRVNGEKISIEFNEQLRSRVISAIDGKDVILGDYSLSEYLILNNEKVTDDFKILGHEEKLVQDKIGKGKGYIITGSSGNLKKNISIISYDDFPTMLFFNISYQNTGKENIIIDGWVNNNYSILQNKNDDPAFWSYQPGSYGWDNDWIIPLTEGYSRDNYLGMNAVDYGGGTPVADIWRSDCGIAVGHVEMVPKLVSLPVSMSTDHQAELAIIYRKQIELKPGDILNTFKTFAAVHKKDHYNSLTQYRLFMERQGFVFKDAPEDAYKTEWCGWGYEKDFTIEQYYNTFPKVKELGLEWIVIDMEWYNNIGDFEYNKSKFPKGERDAFKLIDSIHSCGAKAQLWWMPISAHKNARLLAEHPEYMILNQDGSPIFMPGFFETYYLCPAYKEVEEYSLNQVKKFMREGWDGLKIDGSNLNNVWPCYNPAHNHRYPEESVEALPAFFKKIYETALSINPNATIEICPCGTNQSFYIQPYMNKCVASDPHSSWHVRIKGKTLKALTGSKSVFYGDHVELSDNKSDFASTIGVGGVIGTKFVYPPGVHMNSESGDVSLTPEKEIEWKKWINIYKDNMLTKGNYRGELYDIGYDRPECHAIQKNKIMYYAFYADEFNGEVELRGLKDKTYQIFDYENEKNLGNIKGPIAKIPVSFKRHLLIKAVPK